MSFANAVVRREASALARVREELRKAVGDAGLVDAAATVGNFQRMNRIADATGIPLDAPVRAITADMSERLGSESFASAKNTEPASALLRIISGPLRPLAMKIFGAAIRRLKPKS